MHLKHISTIFKKFPLYIANLTQIMEIIKFYMYTVAINLIKSSFE